MFIFNGDYKDLEQVQPFYDEFKKLKDGTVGFAYNDMFMGKILGIVGKNENTAIYLLQQLDTEYKRRSEIEKLHNSGYRQVVPKTGGFERYENVVKIGNNYSSAGVNEYPKARIFFSDGRMYIVPKGNRSRGYTVTDDSLVFVK